MAIELLRIFILSNILGYVLVNGRPEGAPEQACENDRNLVPNHPPNSPSTSPVPYSVDISGIPSTGYIPGRNYTIILQGSAADRNFRGFMIQGRVRADDSPAGTFVRSANNYQPQCSGNTAATHTARTNKRRVNLVWTAPAAGTGCICFRYAFVDSYNTFWANLMTDCVNENPQTQIRYEASGSISENSFTISLNATVDGEFECSLDGGLFQSCSSGDVFPNLSVGSHNMTIRFTPDGYCQSLMDQLSLDFNIVITTQVTGSTSVIGNTTTIMLDANVNGTYQCSVDGGPFEPCSSGSMYTGLSVGQHTINVRFTPTGSSQVAMFQFSFNIASGGVFSVRATATYSGSKITVSYDVSTSAECTCQLDSGTPEPCSPGHMFNNVPEGEHSVTVTCISTDDPSLTATSTVSGLQFLSVGLGLEPSGTSITVIIQANIEATHRCSLDGGPFVDCFSGFQFTGVSGGRHNVTVESTSVNGLTMVTTSGMTTIRGSDALLITDIITSGLDIEGQVYNFTFNINEKVDDLTINILIDGSPSLVPFSCFRISDEMCFCTLTIRNMEYGFGSHNITFQGVLNGQIRGSATSRFLVTDTAVVKFKDAAYSVVEGNEIFTVVIEKVGSNAQELTLSVRLDGETATRGSDFPFLQLQSQSVEIQPGPSRDIPVNFTVTDDNIVECNETFRMRLISLSGNLLQIDPTLGETVVTIIDDDDTTVGFVGMRTITEGDRGFVEIAYQDIITQTFMVTVESYHGGDDCTLDDPATPGVDYEPVNVTLTFTPSTRSQTVDIVTREDGSYEADGQPEGFCLRITNLTEPCPDSIIIGDNVTVLIAEDDPPQLILRCYTNTTGNSIIGRTISVFYTATTVLAPVFRCDLDGGGLQPCTSPPPTMYGPLSYGNHTVTVEATTPFDDDVVTIIHQVLMVQARLRAVNSSALYISIQSTKDATYRCRLNDGPYFSCNDGDVIANLPPMMYNLSVVATSNDVPPQSASDFVGPVTLTNGSAQSTCSGSTMLISLDGLSTYMVSWRGRGNRVEFELTADGQGWVGIGFSHNRMMAQSDIILGAADASSFFVDDRYAFTRDISVQPPRDPIQNVDFTFASFENGVTTVRFSRQKDTGDVNDFSLSDCIHFLYAWGGDVTNISTGQIAYHGENRRFTSESLECIPTSVTFCPERFDCGDPGTPANGSVTYDDTLEGSIATYSCDFGFRLEGNSERICQSDQTWSGEVPICIRIDCGDPGMPMNATVISNGTYVTSVAEFTCDFGFELIGNPQRVCQPDGTWSNMVPRCRRIDCGDPGMPMNGMVTSNGTYVTSIAEFTCDDGYMLDGDDERVCQPDGTWSNMVPRCPPVDCGSPGTPNNGNAIVISTTFGTTIMYSCSLTYNLCGTGSRTCQANATWSGEVPECIRSVATVVRTPYIVNEDAGTVGIGIIIDQPTCVTLNFTLTPQEQSPVDASTSDFDDTPIEVIIPSGQTSTTVSIPITNDTIVEGDERFDAVLSSNNLTGVIIGTPGQAEVTIIDDNDMIIVVFEMPMYNVTEQDEQVEVCLLSNRNNEVPVSVTIQPEETGSAEEPADFLLATSTVTFAPGQLRACYNQSVVDDEEPESPESFILRIVDNPDITPGVPPTTQINIIDDDGRMIMRNDTVIGDPLYTVPLQISDEMIEADPDVANTSLCYEIHGRSGNTYNLVSDTCVSISADYVQGNTSDINVVGRVGVLAVDNDGNCQRITVDVMECTGTVGSTEVTQGSPYDNAGIRVRKGRRYFRIAVPNCERQDLVSWVICEEGDMLKFVITRGFNLQPTSHGLVGQFWNIPVELEEFTGVTPINDTLRYYTVSVTPPDGDVRSFVGHLYDVTWDFTPVPCVYAGNRNGGPVAEFNNPNDPVIEGNYTQYEVSDIFSTQFTYEQFDESRCN